MTIYGLIYENGAARDMTQHDVDRINAMMAHPRYDILSIDIEGKHKDGTPYTNTLRLDHKARAMLWGEFLKHCEKRPT